MGYGKSGEFGDVDFTLDSLEEVCDKNPQDTVKDAVNASAKTVKKDIQTNAPKRTGRYKKSWRTKREELCVIRSQSDIRNPLSLLAHNRITAPQFIRRGLYPS